MDATLPTLALSLPPERVVAWLLFLGAAAAAWFAPERPRLWRTALAAGLVAAYWPWG